MTGYTTDRSVHREAGDNPGVGRLMSLPGLILALSVLGGAVAAYLTYVHFQEGALVCSTGGCTTVQESSYSTIGPIPIAALGLGMFVFLGVLAGSRLFSWPVVSAETANIAAWLVTLTALMYYAYLVYIELFVLEAICQWCVVTTIVTVFIFAIESVILWRWYKSDIEAELD